MHLPSPGIILSGESGSGKAFCLDWSEIPPVSLSAGGGSREAENSWPVAPPSSAFWGHDSVISWPLFANETSAGHLLAILRSHQNLLSTHH